jgi:hypothetical protein
VGNQWNSSYRSNRKYVFLLPANPSFESQITNLALGKPVRQSTTAHGGEAGRAVDGNTQGVWWYNSLTHTHHEINPWFQVDLYNDATIYEVYFWNRLDCCQERLSNIRVDVLDSPYNGNVVDTQKIQGQAGIMNVVHFDGALGQSVRITLETGGEKQYLSLAEVQIEGTLGPSPTASPTREGLTNVALPSRGAVASNSRTCCGGEASRAIDGNTDGNWNHGSVTHTHHMNYPYWDVALDRYYSISRVDVYNRVDWYMERIEGFVVNIYRGGFLVYTSEPSTIIKSSYSIKIPYIVGDKVQISIPGEGKILSLAEVMVMGVEAEWDGPINVALASNGGEAYQIMTAHGGVASRANDGNTDGYWHGDSVTHTHWLTNPFWGVKLDKFYTISRVDVYNRVDCCSDRIEDFMVTIYRGGLEVFSMASSSEIKTYYTLEIPNVIGDSVEIMVPGTGKILSLAEVLVLGVEAEWNGHVFNNIALSSNGAVASQSSTLSDAVASRAIDGDTDGNYHDGSVAVTNWMRNPVWDVTFDRFYTISHVIVYNRFDCCGDRLKDFVLLIYRGGMNIYSDHISLGVQNKYEIKVPDIIGDKVQILLPGNSRLLTLAEVMVDGTEAEWDGPVNVALASRGAIASQGATLDNRDASLAIDGNTNGYWQYESITATPWMTDPFWEVTLDTQYYISRVDVYNRDDCCSERIANFIITIYNEGIEVFSIQPSSDIKNYYAVDIPVIFGDKVQVMLPGNGKLLSLAEVQVMGTKTQPNSVEAGKMGHTSTSQHVEGFKGVIYQPAEDEVTEVSFDDPADESSFDDTDPYPSEEFDDEDIDAPPSLDYDPSVNATDLLIKDDFASKEESPDSYDLDDYVAEKDAPVIMDEEILSPTASPTTHTPTVYNDVGATSEEDTPEKYDLDDTITTQTGPESADERDLEPTISPTTHSPTKYQDDTGESVSDDENKYNLDDTQPTDDTIEDPREPLDDSEEPTTDEDDDDETDDSEEPTTDEDDDDETSTTTDETSGSGDSTVPDTSDNDSLEPLTDDTPDVMGDDEISNIGNQTDCRTSSFLNRFLIKLIPV